MDHSVNFTHLGSLGIMCTPCTTSYLFPPCTTRYQLPILDQQVPIAHLGPIGSLCIPRTNRYPCLHWNHFFLLIILFPYYLVTIILSIGWYVLVCDRSSINRPIDNHCTPWTTRYPLYTLDHQIPFAHLEPLGTHCIPWTNRYLLPTLDNFETLCIPCTT